MPSIKGRKKKDHSDIEPLLDDEEDLSADGYPQPFHEDLDHGFSTEDFLGEDDDDHDVDDEEEQAYKKRMRTIWMIVGVIVVVVVIIAAFMMSGSSSDDQTEGAAPPVEDKNSSHIQGTDRGVVVNEQVGQTYTGAEEGNPVNGMGAILGFDYHYYTTRSGEQARKFFNPEATSYDAEFIQSNIDKVPQGTTYTLQVTPVVIGSKYDTVLTLNIPGANPVSYNQEMETMQKDGTYYVRTFTSKKAEK